MTSRIVLIGSDLLHNLVHVLFGVMRIAAFAGLFAPRLYAQIVAISYDLLVILGLLPATNTLFGHIPIYGNDEDPCWRSMAGWI